MRITLETFNAINTPNNTPFVHYTDAEGTTWSYWRTSKGVVQERGRLEALHLLTGEQWEFAEAHLHAVASGRAS